MARKKNKKNKKKPFITALEVVKDAPTDFVAQPPSVTVIEQQSAQESPSAVVHELNVRKKIKFSGNDKSVLLKNQIITWILTVNSEMDEFVANLDKLSIEEKSKRITQFYSTLLVINKALDGRSQFYGNQVLLRDFGVAEELE
jgi:hypothetical protein